MLYKLFGKNAELLIDHAWGWEPTTIEAIKAYIVAVTFHQIDHAPHGQTSAERYNESLQNGDCLIDKSHKSPPYDEKMIREGGFRPPLGC